MKAFRIFVIVATLASYLLIFTGGLVRVSGSGLGCPDWPKCYGRWLPPLTLSQLPADIDPASFNFVLAWVEYSNRLFGMFLGIVAAVTAVLALVHHRKTPRILYPTLLAALGVAYAGWQGGQVVTSSLKPILVSVHLVTALFISSMLTYVTQQAYYLEHAEDATKSSYHRGTRLALMALWGLALLQILLGTLVRGRIESLVQQYPLLSDAEIIIRVGTPVYIHVLSGLTVFFATAAMSYLVLGKSRNPTAPVRYIGIIIVILVMLQIPLGIGLAGVGIYPILQVFHMWMAAVYLGLVLLLYGEVRHGEVRTA